MLRNRSRAVTKQSPIMADHQPSSLPSPTPHNPTRSISSFLGSPRFFNGFFLPKKLSDGSPTSILESNKQFSDFAGNPFRFNKNPEKPTKNFDGIKHSSEKFDSEGIALAIVLIEEPNPSGNICKPNLFGSKLKIQIPLLDPYSPNGSPESPGDFGIKTRNSVLSGGATPNGSGSARFSTGPLSLSEMELSEEYTRVISHGPNPKTTHIYDNCVVKSCCGIRVGSIGSEPPLESIVSFCHTCKKNLGEGSDIFMYRGEIGFCSEECRCQEMVLDGLMMNS
ncbi:protein MARD1-like [Cynara cardunculus var. scolymus]|uniref:FLZ-type domain-containing protein n=1 Tax=Cynara cardunculus var. scolymus TaxID=59895 RepID=A0A103XPC1_CYNCS|nr:protein MARD1-like [Cynara cardunculus var. scolymus]KVH94380.1 Protein of unknown function DUF581 [Cynara cardunculus var. scolymus]